MVTVNAYSKSGADAVFAPKDLNDPETISVLQDMFGVPLVYQSGWNAATNTPTLADGTGVEGHFHKVTVGAVRNLGSGSITFKPGDHVVYLSGVWTRVQNKATTIVTDEPDLRVVRGTINTSGAGSIVRGSGFTINRVNTGDLIVTFTTPFSEVPTVTLAVYDNGAALGPIVGHKAGATRTASTFEVVITTVGTGFSDAIFDFIAIGER